MSNEFRAKLLATPMIKLANIGLGEHSHDSGMRILHSLSQRRIWVRQGLAMQDGSFPIPNAQHLRYALEAYEFAENKRKTQRWIVRRAKALSRTDMLPEAWQRTNGIVAAGTDEVVVHPGAMIAIYPPPEIAELLAGPKATDEIAEELHVTLAFLGDDAAVFDATQIADITNAIAGAVVAAEPLEAAIQGWGTFLAKDAAKGNPQWYSVNCVGLSALRTAIVDSLTSVGIEPPTDHDFVPHMTVRYGDPAVTEIPAGGEKTWPVESVYLVMAGDRIPLPIGPSEAEPEVIEEPAPEAEIVEPVAEDVLPE